MAIESFNVRFYNTITWSETDFADRFDRGRHRQLIII